MINDLKRLDFHFSSFMAPALFAAAASIFEGMSVVLLVPLAVAMIQMNFSAIESFPVIRHLLAWIRVAELTPRLLFVVTVSIIILASAAKNIFQYGSMLTTAWIVRRFSNRLRKKIFRTYLKFGKTFFDENNTGYLHHILMNFTQEISDRLVALSYLLNQFFMLTVYLLVMFLISWKLTVVSLCIFPVLYWSVRWIVQKIRKTSQTYALTQKKLSEEIYNVLSCIPLVQAYRRENKEHERFSQMSGSVSHFQFSLDKKCQMIYPVQELIMLLGVIALISAMSYFVAYYRSAHLVGGFLVFFYVIRRATTCYSAVNNMFSVVASITGPAREILKVFEMSCEPRYLIPDGKRLFEGLREHIVFRGLSFAYENGPEILRRIDAKILRGQVTAIVGPTGAGKTTLVNLLMRFYQAPPGQILIDKIPIEELTLDSLRAKIAYVSQEALLFNATIRDNITYGIDHEIGDASLMNVLRQARLEELIQRLPDGLETFVGDRGLKLSGGEKQRLEIARALLKDAEILIFDEATSALDSGTEKMIQLAIEEMIRTRTAIVIAHRLSTIRRADKIIVLENGLIAEEGALEDLLKAKGRFDAYWQEQKFY